MMDMADCSIGNASPSDCDAMNSDAPLRLKPHFVPHNSMSKREPSAKYSSLSCVVLSRLVVRLSSRTPSRFSMFARRALTAEGVMPESRANDAKLPCLTSFTKKSSSEYALIHKRRLNNRVNFTKLF